MKVGQAERADHSQLDQVGTYLCGLREDERFHIGEL